MANSNGYITYPVSDSDIKNVLGIGSTGLSQWCQASQIKMWAKYKPVVKNLINTTGQLDSNKSWLSSATWWNGTNNNCGITFNTYSSVYGTGSAKSAIDGGLVVWGYTKPSGSSSSPFRIIDFNQYNHLAKPPVTGVFATDAVLAANAVMTVNALTTVDDGLSVRLEHIGSFSNYYYLAAIFDSNNNIVLLHTSTKRVGEYEDGEMIEIDIPYNNGSYGYQGKLSENATYKAYMMMSSVPYTCATSQTNGTYIPLPSDGSTAGLGPSTFTAYSSQGPVLNVETSAWVDNPGERILHWKVTSTGQTLPTSLEVSLVYASNRQPVGSSTTKTITIASGSYSRQDTGLGESITLPNTNYDQYLLKFSASGLSAYSGISQTI